MKQNNYKQIQLNSKTTAIEYLLAYQNRFDNKFYETSPYKNRDQQWSKQL